MPARNITLPKRKTALRLLTAVSLATAAVAMVGCSSDRGSPTDSTASTEHAGSIGLDLQLAPGFTLNNVSYTVTGPSGFAKAGVIDVSNSTKISALIGPLPAGLGFSITLSANALRGVGSCNGSASFDIVAGQTTRVAVKVTCHEAPRSGSALINGQLNVCPVVDGASASPGEVAVGGSIALGIAAHDSDAGPSALSYHWTASSGTLSSDAVASPIFTCKSPGTVTLYVTVSDGDPAASCADTGTLTVQCSGSGSGSGSCSSSGYDSITAALGVLTADCRGKVDPNDYVIGQDGRLTPAFDSCPLDANDPQRTRFVRIRQLLSVQHAADLPDVIKCTAGRFQSLKDKFAARGINQCPAWSNKKVVNPITRDVIDKLTPLLPNLGEEDTLVTLKSPFVPPPELGALKVKSTYTVTLPPNTDQNCGTATACAAACAEVFPGFVIPSILNAAPSEDTILVDPESWWEHELYNTPTNPIGDPNNLNPLYYHQMGFVLPTPGQKYGALERWNPCNASGWAASRTAPLLTSTMDVSLTDCQSEKCNYWAGGSDESPSYIKAKLQRWCLNYNDPTTCLSYCGIKPPPVAIP